jgi:hypothetical protein
MHELPEVLPPERLGLVRVWRWDVPIRTFKTARVIGVGGLIVLLGWLFQNFLQLRGVVNLLLSRIDLWLMVLSFRYRLRSNDRGPSKAAMPDRNSMPPRYLCASR